MMLCNESAMKMGASLMAPSVPTRTGVWASALPASTRDAATARAPWRMTDRFMTFSIPSPHWRRARAFAKSYVTGGGGTSW